MDFPTFRYHPDPLASGSIAPSDATCRCCNQQRGYIYVSAPYCVEDLEGALCPWCIADGAAHKRFRAEFTDETTFPPGIAKDVVAEVAFCTPGFSGWQQEKWLTCCNDAAAFLEPVGHGEIVARYPELEGALIAYIVQEMGISGSSAHQLYRSLNRDHGPTAYVFQCRHCANQPAYIDMV